MGVREVSESKTEETIDEVASGKKPTKRNDYFIGTTKLIVPRTNTEIASFMKDGMSNCFSVNIEDFLKLIYEIVEVAFIKTIILSRHV